MGRASDYGHGLYKQLEEVLARLDCEEKTSSRGINHLNDRIDLLEKENADLKKENLLLLNDNVRLKSIINNDSSNTSNPPSTDQKGRKPANTFNGREKTDARQADSQDIKGPLLQSQK
jgi:hypothetical protein